MMVFRKVAPMKYNMCCSLCPVFVLYLLVATSSLVVVCNNDIVKRFNTVLQWLVLFLLNYVYSIKLCVSVSVVPQSVTILRPNVFRERFFLLSPIVMKNKYPEWPILKLQRITCCLEASSAYYYFFFVQFDLPRFVLLSLPSI